MIADRRSIPMTFACSLEDSQSGMETFAKLPKLRPPDRWRLVQFVLVLAVLFACMPAIAWSSHQSKWLEAFAAVLTLLITLGFAVLITGWTNLWFMFKQAKAYQLRTPPLCDERFIGIAYCDQIWTFRSETSWDMGYLSIRGGALRFRGQGPSFDLPLDSITRVWMIAQRGSAFRYPRINVEWIHPTSGPNVLSLEVRQAKSGREVWRLSEEILQLVKDASLKGGSPDVIEWPFESKSLEFSRFPEKQRVVAQDVWVAVFKALIMFTIGLIIARWVDQRFGMFSGGIPGMFGYFTGEFYKSTLRDRVIRRGRS